MKKSFFAPNYSPPQKKRESKKKSEQEDKEKKSPRTEMSSTSSQSSGSSRASAVQPASRPPVRPPSPDEEKSSPPVKIKFMPRQEKSSSSSQSSASSSAVAVKSTAIPAAQPPAPLDIKPTEEEAHYVRRSGKVYKVAKDYKKKDKERWATREEFLNNPGGASQTEKKQLQEAGRQEQARQEEEERQREEARVREEARLQKETRRKVLFGMHGPKVKYERKQRSYPQVMRQEGQRKPVEADLLFRGMSVNNIRNLKKKKPVIFNAQNPRGEATPEEHIANDDPNSPYLSFETGGLTVSAGKYAPKPVDKVTRKPRDVRKEGGFLKQEKSYVQSSRDRNPDAERMGYVAGINPQKLRSLDYSTSEKAQKLKSDKARAQAVADREVLVRPDEEGIHRDQVPFVAKVKEVPEEYYRKHINNQTPTKALGFTKAEGEKPVYHKLQISKKHSDPNSKFGFNVERELQRRPDADDDEMSDIESMEFSDDDSE